MKIMFKNFIYEAIEMYKASPAFKAWFGASKVVDSNGNPLQVYHGSNYSFASFKSSQGNAEGFVGKGFYFTSNPDDAGDNYTGMGPDLKIKVEREIEQIEQRDAEDIAELLKMNAEDVAQMIDDYEPDDELKALIKKYVEAKMVGEQPNIMPCYLRMLNPFYIGMRETNYFEVIYPEDENKPPRGNGMKVLNAIKKACNEFRIDHGRYISRLSEETELMTDFNSNDLFEAMKKADDYLIDEVEGTGEFHRKVIEYSGFDGVIMDARRFQDMPHASNSIHYIVFKPSQIKSVNNLTPGRSPNILKEDQEIS